MRIHPPSIDIDATPERVFAFMTNLAFARRWQPDLVAIPRPLTDGGFRVGARWRMEVAEYGRSFEVETWVVDMTPNERLVYGMDAPTATVEVDYHLRRDGARTRLEVDATITLKGLMRLFSALVNGMVRRKFESRLQLLREAVEAEEANAGTARTA